MKWVKKHSEDKGSFLLNYLPHKCLREIHKFAFHQVKRWCGRGFLLLFFLFYRKYIYIVEGGETFIRNEYYRTYLRRSANHATLSGTDLGVSHPTLFYKVVRVNNFPWSRALRFLFFCFSILFHTARYDSLAFKIEVKLFNYHLQSIQPIENLSVTRWKKTITMKRFPGTTVQSAHL